MDAKWLPAEERRIARTIRLVGCLPNQDESPLLPLLHCLVLECHFWRALDPQHHNGESAQSCNSVLSVNSAITYWILSQTSSHDRICVPFFIGFVLIDKGTPILPLVLLSRNAASILPTADVCGNGRRRAQISSVGVQNIPKFS